MVAEQLIPAGISDTAILKGIEKLPRHKFVPPEFASLAYEDRPVEIGEGQTISQPFIVAYMTQMLELKGDEKVLEVGTGSGYQTALLAMLAREVYSVELRPTLVPLAKQRLDVLELTNVFIQVGDGYLGWKDHAPYDAIIVTAAPEELPVALLDQLAIGGRMIVPVGRFTQDLWLIKRTLKGFLYEKLIPVVFVPMIPAKEYHPHL